jgi:hypothetical protein
MSLVSIGTSPRQAFEYGQILSDYSRIFAAKNLNCHKRAQNSQKKCREASVHSRESHRQSVTNYNFHFPPFSLLALRILTAV